jgi:hypothetical protein
MERKNTSNEIAADSILRVAASERYDVPPDDVTPGMLMAEAARLIAWTQRGIDDWVTDVEAVSGTEEGETRG